MLVFDSHCDTLTKIVYDNVPFSSEKLHLNKGNINPGAQIFACFIGPEMKEPYTECLNLIDGFKSQNFCFAYDYKSMMSAVDSGNTAAFLAVEGGSAVEGDLLKLEHLYKLGVRFMNLTWNHDNEIAGGVGGNGSGVTGFGRKAIKLMNKLGMVIDVSHLSDKSFYDVTEISEKPFIAGHSNSRRLCNHRRNLTDEQFKIIKARGGMVGINFYPEFLSEDKNASIIDVMLHIEHFLELGGENVIGLGSDFDGIESVTSGLENAGKYADLYNEMLKKNYSKKLTDKIFFENYAIFVKNNL